MGVLDGQPVSAAITNPAFINKNNADVMPNILGFSHSGSGSSIADIQAAVNKLYTATGASESQTGTVYSAPAGTISDGDSYQTAFTKIADKFDAATGHKHTGAAGDAPPISGGFISGVPYESFVIPGSLLTSVTGSSKDVTSFMSGKTPSSNLSTLGVTVNSPYNRVFLANGSSSNSSDVLVDSTGNIVYGRLTYATGTWTLSFYSLVGSAETAYSFASATDISWFFRELYQPLVATPVYEPNYFEFEFKSVKSLGASGSLGLFGDVVVAASAGVSVVQSGQNLIFTGSLSNNAPQDVGSSAVVGVAADSSRSDHVHRGVHSVAATGSAAIYGDIIFQAASGVAVLETGQNLLYSVDYYTSAPSSVGSSNAIGSSTKPPRGDHTHQGVHSVAATGSSALFGDVVFQAASGTLIQESAQNILYSVDYSASAVSVGSTNSAGSSLQASRGDHVHQGLHSIAASGNTALFGDTVLVGGLNVTLTQTGQNIQINASASGGGGMVNGPITTPNLSSGSQTIATGYSMWWPYLTIILADTFTVQTGAELLGASYIIANGTLTINSGGEARIL